MRKAILTVSLLGVIIFTPVLALTFYDQKAIADSAKEFIVEKTKEKYSGYRSKIGENPTAEKALDFLKDKYQEKYDKIDEDIKKLDKIITAYLEALCEKKICELKEQILSDSESSMRASFSKAINNVDNILKGKTQEVLSKLIMDVRIFSGTNTLIFAFIFIVALFASGSTVGALTLPLGLLSVASFTASFIYIFEQNWFFTVLYSNYWGFSYVTLVTVIFIFLVDIIMNKARVTRTILDSIASTLSIASPC